MSKIKEALIRGGHNHPEQILADLEAGGFIVTTQSELDEEYIKGYSKGLDVGKDRYG